ncbi:l-asparagine oxygenase [Anaeramoeba flamelloides]|uniref:L-asparagine oxygenase n=1 Tax=Anaeramoeba flamelloides TaxID=1746091 RepID=A0AAV7YPJ9_9EUKA|nr:l-asparagine oxygenase [Anaeramoeba flamelloides]
MKRTQNLQKKVFTDYFLNHRILPKFKGVMQKEEFSMRVFDTWERTDLVGHVTEEMQKYGYVRVTNTGIQDKSELISGGWLDSIGMKKENKFAGGGRTNNFHWIDDDQRLRRMDYYPPGNYLLPSAEVQYQSSSPLHVLIYCNKVNKGKPKARTFIHDVQAIEDAIHDHGTKGRALLEKLFRYGVSLEFGFLDQKESTKVGNYYHSWQEHFGTSAIGAALRNAQQQPHGYDKVWLHGDGSTVMTSTTLPSFTVHPINGKRYLRLPRIALTGPEKLNGYRSFKFGNNTEFTEYEKALLVDAYLETREGIEWKEGEFVLMDNIRCAHSKEMHDGNLDLLVAMSDDLQNYHRNREAGKANKDIFYMNKTRYQYPKVNTKIKTITDEKYTCPPNEYMWNNEEFSARIVDIRNDFTDYRVSVVNREFQKYGCLNIINTGLTPDSHTIEEDSKRVFEGLYFGQKDRFAWGGRTSGRTTRGVINEFLRTVDFYPPERVLLVHNEILYQQNIPHRLLLHCMEFKDPTHRLGGRTFGHNSKLCEEYLMRSETGERLIEKMKKDGFTIITGFVDENHPRKSENYFRSWQERFQTKDIQDAIKVCREAKDQFDKCWIREETVEGDDKKYITLMTSINVSAYRDGYMLFPRISLDGPQFVNGWRKYLIGDEELTFDEIQVLLDSYWYSRQGRYYKEGDLLLIDNIKVGHSRESFRKLKKWWRKIGISMSTKKI